MQAFSKAFLVRTLLYTTSMLNSPQSTTATLADDTSVVATDCDPAVAS
jgi:hypothetical protein